MAPVSSSSACGPAASPRPGCASMRGSKTSDPAQHCDSGSTTIQTSGQRFALVTSVSSTPGQTRGGPSYRLLAEEPSRSSTARATRGTTMRLRSRTTCSRRFAGQVGDPCPRSFSHRCRRSALTSQCGLCDVARETRSTDGTVRPTDALSCWGVGRLKSPCVRQTGPPGRA